MSEPPPDRVKRRLWMALTFSLVLLLAVGAFIAFMSAGSI